PSVRRTEPGQLEPRDSARTLDHPGETERRSLPHADPRHESPLVLHDRLVADAPGAEGGTAQRGTGRTRRAGVAWLSPSGDHTLQPLAYQSEGGRPPRAEELGCTAPADD